MFSSKTLKQACFLCNKPLSDEILLDCYFTEFPKERKNNIDSQATKKAHYLCSLFFAELELIIQNGQAFFKGGQKIKSSHYLEECKICASDAMGACLIKCACE